MGPIIPASVAMLIYAYVYGGGISVGKLFLMEVVPGVLVAVALMALVWVSARQRHFPKSDTKFSLGGIVRSLRGALLGLVVPVIIRSEERRVGKECSPRWQPQQDEDQSGRGEAGRRDEV